MKGGKDDGIAVERRDTLDGGLDSRSGPYDADSNMSPVFNNMDFSEKGSAATRPAGTLLKQSTWAGSGVLPPPVLTRLAGGGTLAAGTYNVAYWLSYSNAGLTIITGPSQSATIAGILLNDRIQIDIPPNNLGEGVGSGAEGADDPFSGTVAGPELTRGDGGLGALVQKSGDPSFTVQTLSTAFTWNTASRVRRGVLSAYAIGSTQVAQDGAFALRKLIWHPSLQLPIAVTVDNAIAFAQDFSAFTRMAIAADKAGNNHFWSRLMTPMFAAIVDQILVIGDNLGRPKRLHWTGSASTSNFRLLGANVPASAPTIVINVAAGVLNGAYQYKVAFVYRDGRPDLTTLDVESNSTAASNSVSPANQKIDVTIPGSSETGLQFRRVYRTKAGGTVFFFHSDQAAGTGNLTFTDNTADSALGTSTPVDDLGKVGNDVPSNRLAFLVSHKSRIFAWLANYIVDSSNRVTDFIATNVAAFTKAPAFGTSEAVNAWPAIFQIDCGDGNPVTGAISMRGTLYVFKAASIGGIFGSTEDDFEYDDIATEVGAMRFSIIGVGSLIYFWEDARGPMVFDGHSAVPIGYMIQPTWDFDRQTTKMKPVAVWFDPRRNEIHWAMNNFTIAPGNLSTNSLQFAEYVFHVPSKAWSYWPHGLNNVNFAKGRTITSAARCVLSGGLFNPAAQLMDLVYADLNGRAVLEGGTFNYNLASIPDAVGNSTLKVKLFYGDNWQSSKQYNCLMLETSLPVGSSIAVAMDVSSNDTTKNAAPTAVTIINLTGDANRQGDRVDFIDIPTETFVDPQNAGGKINEDRGLLVFMTITSANAFSPVIVRGAALHYKEKSDIRRYP